MIKDSLYAHIKQGKELYLQNRLLFMSSLFLPLIAPLFFYCPTSILRTIFYISVPFLCALLIKNRHEIKRLLTYDKIIWGIMAIFVVFMSASVFWSDQVEASRYFSKGKLFFILGITTLSTFYISYKFPGFSATIKKLYIFGATSSALILIANYLIAHGFSLQPERLEGMGRASNPVQASLVYGLAIIAITFGKFPDHYSKRQVYFLKTLMMLPSLSIILLTQSRGPFLALIVTLTVLFILKPGNRVRTAICVGIGLCLLSIPFYSVLKYTDIVERKTTGRFEIWDTAINQIKEKPITGNGLATNNRYNYTKDDGTHMTASHIHSLYLSTLFQGGAVGLGLLLSIYFIFAKRYFELIANNGHEYVWIGGWVLMGTVFGIADFGGIVINLSTEWLVFWWPIGLVLGQIARNKQGGRKELPYSSITY